MIITTTNSLHNSSQSSQHTPDLENKQLLQLRTESTFKVRRIKEDQPSATAILNDLCSAKSAADYYCEEIEKRH